MAENEVFHNLHAKILSKGSVLWRQPPNDPQKPPEDLATPLLVERGGSLGVTYYMSILKVYMRTTRTIKNKCAIFHFNPAIKKNSYSSCSRLLALVYKRILIFVMYLWQLQ